MEIENMFKLMNDKEREEFVLFVKDLIRSLNKTLDQLEIENDMFAMVNYAAYIVLAKDALNYGMKIMHSETAEKIREEIKNKENK